MREVPDGEWWIIGFDANPYVRGSWWTSARRFSPSGQPIETEVNRGWRPVGIAGPITFQEVREQRPTNYTLDPMDPDGDYAKHLSNKLWREWVPSPIGKE